MFDESHIVSLVIVYYLSAVGSNNISFAQVLFMSIFNFTPLNGLLVALVFVSKKKKMKISTK